MFAWLASPYRRAPKFGEEPVEEEVLGGSVHHELGDPGLSSVGAVPSNEPTVSASGPSVSWRAPSERGKFYASGAARVGPLIGDGVRLRRTSAQITG